MKKLLIIGAAVAAFATGSTAFAEDAYIESDGTNTVNIGYYANPKTKIVIDFKLNEVARNYDTVLGHYGNDFSVLIYCPGTDFQLEAKDGGHSTLHMSPQIMGDTARHTAVIDAPGRHAAMYAADGTLEGEADFPSTWTLTKTSNWPFLLFGSSQNTSGAARQCVKARIYAVKIYEKENGVETLVRDLVPCLKGDRVGFYDMANGIFYGGQGSLKGLAHGGDGIMKLQDDGYLATPSSNNSSAHVSFNTGYYMTHDSRVEVDFQWLGTPANLLFGAWDGGAVLRSGFWINSDAFSFIFGENSGLPSFSSGIAKNTYRHKAIIDAKSKSFRLLQESGFVEYRGTTTAACTNNAAWPIVLFGAASDASGAGKQWSYARIFSAKIYTNDTVLVKDFEPYVKDGVVGFMEKVSGTFSEVKGISAGGDIEYNRKCSYVENDGTTVLNLGYRANMKSRIEVDYQCLNPTATKVIFGAWERGQPRYCCWNNSSHEVIFNFSGVSGGAAQSATGVTADSNRHTAIMDLKNHTLAYVTGGVTNNITVNSSAKFNTTDVATDPMGVFGSINNGVATMVSTSRIYSVRIYEDEELIHEFLPYTDGTTTSLRDVITGHVATKVASTMVDPTISGIGADGVERWFVTPQSASIRKDQTTTLTAIAAGAVLRYKWTRNGEVLSGGSNGELNVSWRHTKTPDVYAVTPVYSLAGAEVEGAAVSVMVENVPQGMVIIFK